LDIPIEIPAKAAFFSAAKTGEWYDTLVQIEAAKVGDYAFPDSARIIYSD
jgi:hypothetical protein